MKTLQGLFFFLQNLFNFQELEDCIDKHFGAYAPLKYHFSGFFESCSFPCKYEWISNTMFLHAHGDEDFVETQEN